MDNHIKKEKWNIATAMLLQVVTMISGLILPQLFVRSFGSEVYGLTTSITHFLAYIALLDGGVSGVARAALYKPLAEQDTGKISSIYYEVVRFFRSVGIIFVFYAFALAAGFKFITQDTSAPWSMTFWLVLVMSISTFAQYFFGISNFVLIQADQKHYINNILIVILTVVNTLLVIVLVKLGLSITAVKLISGCVYFFRPVVLLLYVKSNYHLQRPSINEKISTLGQKWTALGQHIAYFLHSNTDVVILTMFSTLENVAVYAVYNMVVTSIRGFVMSVTNGLEAILGNMYAKNEHQRLNRTFSVYETILSIVAVVLFSVTCVLIVPFVRLYTAGVTDADYIQPLFGALLALAELVYCMRIPYHYMVNAAGRFQQTKIAAYGEAAINIGGSLLLVKPLGLVGVAAATLAATMFRTIYYAYYLTRHVIHRKFWLFIRRQSLNVLLFIGIAVTGGLAGVLFSANTLFTWVLYACVTTVIATVIVLAGNFLFYREEMKAISDKLLKK